MRASAVIPAYQAERTVGDVVHAVIDVWPGPEPKSTVIVVDDGSTDRTAEVARCAGARVISHPQNRGKGAALRTGMAAARAAGFDVCVTIDADGQHPANEARRLLDVEADEGALVLGVRDLVAAGAPRPNQISNRISNFFLSVFSGVPLADTQCGLRRYPLVHCLDRASIDAGYAFEAEVILRAVASGVRIVEVPVEVIYPPERDRVTHFDSVRDPARIISRVLKTLFYTNVLGGRTASSGARTASSRRG